MAEAKTSQAAKPIVRKARDWAYWRAVAANKKLQRLMSDRAYTVKRFEEVHGRKPDLDRPETFNEKIAWLKLNDRRDIHRRCADKVEVAGYVRDVMGEDVLIPTLAVLDTVDDLDPSKLPEGPFVLKATHDSGSAVVVRDARTADWPKIRSFLTKKLATNDYWKEREWQYKSLTPRIMVQQALLNENGQPPEDLKIHVFNGRVRMIQVDQDRFGDHKRVIYDRDWSMLPFDFTFAHGHDAPRPPELDRMVELAERVGKDFDYVRVDFYAFEGKVWFGEITFHPAAGHEIFDPPSADREVGSWLTLTELEPPR